MDLYARRIVGWSTAEHLETSLCLEALQRALGHRTDVEGLIHHSDRGVQYASARYRETLDAQGIACSMSRRANCWDDAVAESFFGSLKNELIYRRPWSTREEARDAIGEYIEIFYNRIRRHSTIGGMSPAKFEEDGSDQGGLGRITRVSTTREQGHGFRAFPFSAGASPRLPRSEPVHDLRSVEPAEILDARSHDNEFVDSSD